MFNSSPLFLIRAHFFLIPAHFFYHGLEYHGLEYHGRESYHFHCVSAANAWASAHALSMVMWFNQQIVTDLRSLLNIFCSAWLRTLQ